MATASRIQQYCSQVIKPIKRLLYLSPLLLLLFDNFRSLLVIRLALSALLFVYYANTITLIYVLVSDSDITLRTTVKPNGVSILLNFVQYHAHAKIHLSFRCTYFVTYCIAKCLYVCVRRLKTKQNVLKQIVFFFSCVFGEDTVCLLRYSSLA